MAKYTKETDVLFQYSQGFRLIVPNAYKTCHTQFYSVDYPNGLAIAPSSYIVEGGKTYCPVPNQMTVKPNSIIVFAYLLEESRAITESKTVLEVWERPKPPDFVFDPTDTVTYATATELISDMEATLGKFTNVSASATGGESAQASASISETGLEFTFVLPKGDKGDTGVSIATVSFKEYDSNGGAVYTITMDDGSTTTFTAPKGSQGDKGNTGDTGATISSVTFKEYDSNGGAVYTITMTDGVTAEFTAPKGQKGDKGDIGDTGATGNGIESITLVSGSHAAGTTDTYRITFTNGETADFTVYNGANGEGAGDMLWEEFNARLNPSGKNVQIAFESELPTSEQKSAWSAKYNKPTGGIPKTDLASSVQTSLDKADTALQEHQDISALTNHVANNSIHVTTDDKTAWNAKYNKPSGGIPKSDLASDIQTSLVPSSSSSDAGKTLTVNSSGMPAWADASPSGADVFLVTFTQDTETGDFTADKTFAEVMVAYEAGKIVLGKFSNYATLIGQLSIVSGGNVVCFTFNELFDSDRLLAFMLGANDMIMSMSFPYYVPEFSQYTILTSGWSGGVYSFESDFPNAFCDIEIELDSTATESQVEAWSSAKMTAVFNTNKMKALGDIPTVDIPVIVKKVVK